MRPTLSAVHLYLTPGPGIPIRAPLAFDTRGPAISAISSLNMDEDETLVRRRSRRSTAGNRYAACTIFLKTN